MDFKRYSARSSIAFRLCTKRVSHAAEIDTGTRVKETTEVNAAKAAGDMKNGIDNEPPEVSVLPKIDEVK